MKYLKQYEEKDWKKSALNTLSNITGLTYLKNRKSSFDKYMEITSGYWIIEEYGNLIKVYIKVNNNPDPLYSNKLFYKIEKDKRTITFLKNYTDEPKAKLSSEELNNLLDGLYWCKDVEESIGDCFHDLKDDGFEVSLINTDFRKKSIFLFIEKDTRFKLFEARDQLKDLISKVCGEYGVKLDYKYRPNGIYRDIFFINHPFKLEYIGYADITLKELFIPFIEE